MLCNKWLWLSQDAQSRWRSTTARSRSYFQLKTLLLDDVLSGEYRPGDRLPTEHELCRRFGISRTPVSRALSELAEEGVLVRQRRNGTFVNPHWLRRPSDRAEVRIVVPEGPWESMIRAAATSTAVGVSVVTVPRPTLHQFLTHAVAEGQAPDLALLDSVWLPEFAEAGFVHALEDVDERWIRDEYEVDFLAPLVAAEPLSAGGHTPSRRSRTSSACGTGATRSRESVGASR